MLQVHEMSEEDVAAVNRWLEEATILRSKILDERLLDGAKPGSLLMAVAHLVKSFKDADPQLWEFCTKVVETDRQDRRVLN